jgi:cysteine desulfurase
MLPMSYFDNNATTQPCQKVLDAVAEAHRVDWANPSSPYRLSAVVRAKLERARADIAEYFSASPNQLLFTSGATEANNTYLAHQYHRLRKDQKVLISPIEHPSVSEPATSWFAGRVDWMPVDDQGLVALNEVEKQFQANDYGLVCLMAANNETGVLQPWEPISQICKARQIPFFCDATQWVGKMEISSLCACSAFSFSGHKFGGTKGIGGLVSKEPIHPMIKGGRQEKDQRGGTENFPNIAGLLVACKERLFPREVDNILRVQWRNDFELKVCALIPGTEVVAEKVERLWNTSLLLMPIYENLRWISHLEKLGFQVSTGAACSVSQLKSDKQGISAIGLSPVQIRRVIRVSSSWRTAERDWQGLAEAMATVFSELARESGESSVISL